MELHDLESAWQSLDRRVAQQDLEIAALRKDAAARRLRNPLRTATAGQVVQLVVGVLFALWGGGYWFDHLGTAHLVAYGLAVHLYGVALLGAAIAMLVRLAAVDHAQPVADVQRRLLELRRTRLRTEAVLWLAGAVMWVPILMIALRAIGIDAWTIHPAYVLWNLAIGLALALAAAWVMWRRPAWFAKLAMDGKLREVDRQLAEIEG